MVRNLIASAAVVTALGALAGVKLGDPLGAHQPMPEARVDVPAGCHFQPQLEMLPRLDQRSRDMEDAHWQEVYLREQLGRRAVLLAECAKLYGEPGAEQLARVTVMHTGEVRDVEVRGAFVSEALGNCVQSTAMQWGFRAGTADFVLTLPVQYCP